MEDERIISCLAWSKPSCLAETVIVVELISSTPLSRERRVGNNCIKLSVTKGIGFECVAILNTEVAEFDAMKEHIHAGKIVGCGILLLSEYLISMSYTCCTEQQRAATAGWIINIAKACMAEGYNFSQDTANFLRSVKLTGFLSCTGGKLANHILISIAKNINLL